MNEKDFDALVKRLLVGALRVVGVGGVLTVALVLSLLAGGVRDAYGRSAGGGAVPSTIGGSHTASGAWTFQSLLTVTTVASGSPAITIPDGTKLCMDGASTKCIDYDGTNASTFTIPAAVIITGGNLTANGDTLVVGNTTPVIRNSTTTAGMVVRATTTNSSGNYGLWLGSTTNLTTQGTRAVNFGHNNGTSTAAVGAVAGEYIVTTHGDSTGTPGAATLNTAVGSSAVASGAASVVITNSVAATTSIIQITPTSTTANCVGAYVTKGSGSFTVTCPGGNAAANFLFDWGIIN